MLSRVWIAALIVGVLGCAGAASGPDRARPILSIGRDDRVVIPAMTVVQGVALTPRYVFIATPFALGVFDRQFEQWLPPVTARDGWPNGTVQSLVGDPYDDVVWIATLTGLYSYRASLHQLSRTGFSDTPRQFLFDRADPASGAYIVGAQRVWRLSSSGMAQPISAAQLPPADRRIVPASLRDIYARYPAVRDFELLVTQDADLRSFPVTSGALAPERSEVWLGTAGAGVVKVDPVFTRGTPQPFGLLEPGAGAIAVTSDGVWVGGAGDRITPRSGVTYADHDLSHWRWLDGGAFGAFGGASVQALAPWASSVWVGTDRGLVRLDAGSGRADRRLTEADGLPSSLVLSLAPRFDGVWVGTARGLVFVADSGRAAQPQTVQVPTLENTAVRALQRRGDTLWIGTDNGVAVLPASEVSPRRLASAQTSPRFAQPIRTLAIADSVLAVGTTRGELLLFSTRDGLEVTPYTANVARTGGIAAIAMDASSLWVAGPMGVMLIERASGVSRFLAVGSDLPGEATGVAITRDYAWIATRDGVVRVRRLPDGSIR